MGFDEKDIENIIEIQFEEDIMKIQFEFCLQEVEPTRGDEEVFDDTPNVLYHYTSGEGLLGIIKNKEIWATNVRYMNDISELEYGCKIIKDSIIKFKERNQSEHILNVVLDYFLNEEISDFEREWDVYIACFCKNGDKLSQWRGYGGNGDGFSIGIHRSSFRLASWFSLIKVIYTEEEQEARVFKILNDYCCAINIFIKKYPTLDKNYLINYCEEKITNELLNLAFTFKNKVFDEEEEWRIIKFNDRNWGIINVEFRTNKGEIIPFTKIRFDNSASDSVNLNTIKQIYIGPTLEPLKTKITTEMLLRKYGFNQTGVKSSEIPYRP